MLSFQFTFFDHSTDFSPDIPAVVEVLPTLKVCRTMVAFVGGTEY